MLLDAMEDMQMVGAYHDCRNIEQIIPTIKPDVILMDINMPHVDGIQGLKKVKEIAPEVKVIMVTVFEDENKILEAICAGADGYILKQTTPSKLIDGIVEVMQGGAPMTPSIASKVLKLFTMRQKKSSDDSFNLTNREKEILSLLVEGYSYKMIAQKCFVTYATVNKHISNIYTKLQVHSVAEAVSKALREGIV